eukprot:scaffold179176_cov35-Tisochrysis_lutea.AAC.2
MAQVFDEKDAPRPIDVGMILAAKQPAACMPGGRGFLSEAVSAGELPRVECNRLHRQYQVQPGVSWGGLPAPLEERWHSLDCDHLSGR